eukprot:COSAG02_NODE_8492_length_2551_cov_1.455954_1_plen_51_part_10
MFRYIGYSTSQVLFIDLVRGKGGVTHREQLLIKTHRRGNSLRNTDDAKLTD